ncbi:MAG: TetR family transcriptional regulator [Canibacter sp.]
MRNSLADVVTAAMRVLAEDGLEGCSMRRVAAALGVQPSALYHHVENKQSLLALMADEIVRPVAGDGARELCVNLRGALLTIRDGAEVVATALAFRLGASLLEQEIARTVGEDGAHTLLLYTLGHTQSTQTREQAIALGAVLPESPDDTNEGIRPRKPVDSADSFTRGLDIILRGLAAQESLKAHASAARD